MGARWSVRRYLKNRRESLAALASHMAPSQQGRAGRPRDAARLLDEPLPSVLRKQWLWGRFCLACRIDDKAFAHLPDPSPRQPPFYCSLGSVLREDVSSVSLSYSVFPPRRDFSLVKTQGRKSELASLIPFSLGCCLTYEALLAFPAATPCISQPLWVCRVASQQNRPLPGASGHFPGVREGASEPCPQTRHF